MAFYGEYEVAVTDGGRIVLPKKIRENVKGEVFILTKGYGVCLAGYDKEDWSSRSKALVEVSLIDTEYIDKRRKIFSGANEIAIDEQGRFVVPKALADFIMIDQKSITIVGVGDHFELWNSEKWREYLKKISV